MILPSYHVYIPSRGRPDTCLTAATLAKNGVPNYTICVAPREVDAYAASYGPEHVVALSSDNLTLAEARNWIKDFSVARGEIRHWQLDDDLFGFGRRFHGKRLNCDAGLALRVAEDFSDRYTNVAISGLVATYFIPDRRFYPPFVTNCHVYQCTLVNNAIPHRWRGPYNEDTDICLQVLADGWCTVLFNAFWFRTPVTMAMRGGMTDANQHTYQGDGRLKMARTLERRWPGVVSVGRRWQRPQHMIVDGWKRFDQPLIRRPDFDPSTLPKVDEYGVKLVAQGDVQSPLLRSWLAETEVQ